MSSRFIGPKGLGRAITLGALLLLGCSSEPAESERSSIGTLERDRYDLVAASSEPIAEILVTEGQSVEPGDVLVRLDGRRLVARHKAAESTALRHRARIAELERGGRSERRQQAEAQIAADRSDLAQARLDVERFERLVADKVTPQSDLDLARTRFSGAQARLAASQASLRELRAGATDEELSQARADLETAEANVADLQVDVERMDVKSPVPAIVEALPYEIGELPGAGATVVTLLARSAPWARIYLPEPLLATATVGAPARIEVDGVAESFPGCVRFISREATFTPYFSLSEHDRQHLSYVTEIEVIGEAALQLPTGIPLRAWISDELSLVHAEQCGTHVPANSGR